MSQDHPTVAGSKKFGRGNIVPVILAEGRRAHVGGDTHPTKGSQHRHDEQQAGSFVEGAQENDDVKKRQAAPDFNPPLCQQIGLPTQISREPTHHDSQRIHDDAEEDRAANDQLKRPKNHRQHIRPGGVRAQQVPVSPGRRRRRVNGALNGRGGGGIQRCSIIRVEFRAGLFHPCFIGDP